MPSFRLSTKSSCHQMSRSRGATGGVLVSAQLHDRADSAVLLLSAPLIR
jgi:hypothetical protein